MSIVMYCCLGELIEPLRYCVLRQAQDDKMIMIYRPIDLIREHEQVSVMMMWYRELMSSYQNPLHQTEWPLGIIESGDMQVKYIGAFDTSPISPPSQGGGKEDALAGMIGYTTVYFDVKGAGTKPLAVFEVMMFVREEY